MLSMLDDNYLMSLLKLVQDKIEEFHFDRSSNNLMWLWRFWGFEILDWTTKRPEGHKRLRKVSVKKSTLHCEKEFSNSGRSNMSSMRRTKVLAWSRSLRTSSVERRTLPGTITVAETQNWPCFGTISISDFYASSSRTVVSYAVEVDHGTSTTAIRRDQQERV